MSPLPVFRAHRRTIARTTAAAAIAATLFSATAFAQAPAPADSSTREVRWTGPLVTGAPPMPEGALNVEPYLVQTQVTGAYDRDGHRSSVDGVPEEWLIAVPITYGVTDKLTVGITPRATYARTTDRDREWELSDTSVSAQYSLFRADTPDRTALAVGVRQNMPTGRHDQLDRYGLADASGSGAAFTTLGLYGQTSFLAERNLRTRFNVFYRIGGAGVNVDGRSGYGTAGDYQGRVHLGEAWQVNLGAEYSVSPQWVLAADVVYEREQGARLHRVTEGYSGQVRREDERRDSSWRVSVAPAVEYHWTRNTGLIVGALVSLDGRNSSEIFSPQVALNMGF
ncbi:MAG TPA: hypothetical protein VGC74_04875 [Stenotrophomonas sp.]|jgi:hypothetical protein